jgi:hypothetical protein
MRRRGASILAVGLALALGAGGSAAARAGAESGSNRLIFWAACPDVASLSDRELATWKARGVDGFVCMVGRLPGLGGTDAYRRYLRTSEIGTRARRAGLKLYLGFYASNYYNTATPFKGWFDDAGWSNVVLPGVEQLAATANRLGFAGVAVDQELYPQVGGAATASWSWRYRGNSHSERQVRAEVRVRGRQLMRALLRGFPGLELAAYDTELPDSWDAAVQQVINQLVNAYAADVRIELWDGLSSVRGYTAIRWLDAAFYKTPHVDGATWDAALQYNANRVYSLLSRRFSNWAYASSRLHLSPFSWIDAGNTAFESARPPGYVRTQLAAFRRWAAGGEFANYVYGRLRDFDYTPYVPGMRAASAPGTVDVKRPSLVVQSIRTSAGVRLAGFATDNLAVRAVLWRDERGHAGAARMRWQVQGGNVHAGWHARMRWWIDSVPLRPSATTRIHIRVEDLKGLARERVLVVRSAQAESR